MNRLTLRIVETAAVPMLTMGTQCMAPDSEKTVTGSLLEGMGLVSATGRRDGSHRPEETATAGDAVAAVSVSDFLNSIGVCTHIRQGIDDPSRSAAALAYAGVRNIRDDYNPRRLEGWIAVHEQAGVKIVLTWSGPDDVVIGILTNTSKKLAAAGALLTMEGPNEANNWAVTYQGRKSQATVTFIPVANWQRAFYEQVKSDPVLKDHPVFHASEADKEKIRSQNAMTWLQL